MLPVPVSRSTQVSRATRSSFSRLTFLSCSEDGCKGEGTPPIDYPGIDNFETSGIYGLYKSWGCFCGETCVPY